MNGLFFDLAKGWWQVIDGASPPMGTMIRMIDSGMFEAYCKHRASHLRE
jgi:hypothetical protein